MDGAGRTVLVMGSTDGLGRLVAHRLAEAGARVLLKGRSRGKGERVLAELRAATGNDGLEYHRAHLASLAVVRGRREVSVDGHELRFAVNYLAGYLLTGPLLPTLIRSTPARSAGQHPIDFSDVMGEHAYDGMRAYRQSKLAQVMFTFDRVENLKAAGVTATRLHPGTLMKTRMVTEAGVTPMSRVEDGAEAVLHLATAPELGGVTGLYCDGMRPGRAHAQAYDVEARRRLRGLSDELTKLPATE